MGRRADTFNADADRSSELRRVRVDGEEGVGCAHYRADDRAGELGVSRHGQAQLSARHRRGGQAGPSRRYGDVHRETRADSQWTFVGEPEASLFRGGLDAVQPDLVLDSAAGVRLPDASNT